jgi:hypothetical protein
MLRWKPDDLFGLRMSQLGHDRKFELLILMSAMPAKADVLGHGLKSPKSAISGLLGLPNTRHLGFGGRVRPRHQ